MYNNYLIYQHRLFISCIGQLFVTIIEYLKQNTYEGRRFVYFGSWCWRLAVQYWVGFIGLALWEGQKMTVCTRLQHVWKNDHIASQEANENDWI